MSLAGRGRALPILLLVALATPVSACDPDGARSDDESPPSGGAAATDTVVDAEGRTVVLEGTPSRIVSLVPSATRTLVALGATGALVGRTDFDTATVLADLPSVGGGLQPSAEVLLSLRPDLVVRFAGQSDRKTPDRLDRAGVTHLAVRPERIEEVHAMIRTLGRITGRTGAADSLLARHRRTLDSIRARTAGLEPVRVVFTLGGDPPYVAGPETFVGELLAVAGGENVFGDLERPWAGVSPETVLARDPRVILTMEGTPLDPRLTRGRRVRRVPHVVQLPGPELDRAAFAIARALRPGLFGSSREEPEASGAPEGRR